MVCNQTITFLKKTTAGNELKQKKPAWADSGHTALAEVSSVTGKLYYEAARAGEENTMLFKFNYSFLPKDFNKIDYRVLYNGKQYEIKHVADVKERHRKVQLRGESV